MLSKCSTLMLRMLHIVEGGEHNNTIRCGSVPILGRGSRRGSVRSHSTESYVFGRAGYTVVVES